jgi:hypothetical protein
MDTELAPRRCNATNRAGEQCGRAPIYGGDVCDKHGGKAPQTVAAAKRRLLAGADLAIDYMLSMLEPRPACETCGRSDADRDPVVLRACQLVLDRAGFGPSASLQVRASEPKAPGYVDWLTHDELTAMGVMMDAAQRRMEAGEPPRPLYKPTVVVDEGVLIDDEDARLNARSGATIGGSND